jgi:heterodisulfide reductase subunit A-like polyferredoxin
LTVRTIVAERDQQQPMSESLRGLVAEARLSADTDVLVRRPDTTIDTMMCRASRDADLVFLGLALPEPAEEEAYAARLTELAPLFRATVFVRNNGPFRGQLL